MSKENKGLAPPASQDRVTDERSREGASPPSGSVPTGAAPFTPGPWEYRRARHPDNTGGYDYAIAAGGKIIAEAFENVGYADGRPGYDSRPVAANARLIAAAPELYEALEAMQRAWLDYHDAHSLTEPVTGRSGNAFDMATAALAKASGL